MMENQKIRPAMVIGPLGEPLTHFHGVLRGVPTIMGDGPAMAKGKKE